MKHYKRTGQKTTTCFNCIFCVPNYMCKFKKRQSTSAQPQEGVFQKQLEVSYIRKNGNLYMEKNNSDDMIKLHHKS